LLSQASTGLILLQMAVRNCAAVMLALATCPVRMSLAASLVALCSTNWPKNMTPTSIEPMSSMKNTGAIMANSSAAEPARAALRMRLAARRNRPRALARHLTATAFTASKPLAVFLALAPCHSIANGPCRREKPSRC